jgi:aspartate aminotransferase
MSSIVVSNLASQIQPSPTLAIDAKAKKMKAEGIDVVGFGAGEPDFETPDHIKRAGIEAIEKGFTRYTPASGTEELKKAVADYWKKWNGLDYTPNQVVVSCGAKHSITNVCLAVLNPGDEAIIPAPYWVSYPEMVKMAGAKPVILNTKEEDDYLVDPVELEKAITSKTKLFILNSPSNPTGSVYSQERLEAIAKVIAKHGIPVLSDEIYDRLVYAGAKAISFATLPGMKDLTLTVNGTSKTYAMTGWRIGYCAGPEAIMKAIGNIQSHATSNPTSISQKAAVAALSGPSEPIEAMRQEFDKRRQRMVALLNAIPGVKCPVPKGAFYAFPNISSLYGKSLAGKTVSGSAVFASLLLEDSNVALVPGADFGAENCIRLSYATSMANIEKGVGRIAEFCAKLR